LHIAISDFLHGFAVDGAKAFEYVGRGKALGSFYGRMEGRQF
jgi:hypothetical protein